MLTLSQVRRVDVWLCIASGVAIIGSIFLLLKARAVRDFEWTSKINLHLGALVVLSLFFGGGALAKTISVPFMASPRWLESADSAGRCLRLAQSDQRLGLLRDCRYRRLRDVEELPASARLALPGHAAGVSIGPTIGPALRPASRAADAELVRPFVSLRK